MVKHSLEGPTGRGLRGRLAFLLKDSLVYGGAAAISKAFTLITFPLLARNLSVAEFGEVDFLVVLANFLTILLVFGQDSAVARYFYEYEDHEERRQLISQSLALQLFTTFLCVPLLLYFQEYLPQSSGAQHIIFIIILQLPFLLVINFAQNLMKWTFERSHFIVMTLGFTIVQTALLAIVFMLLDVGVKEVLFVMLASAILFGVLGLYWIRRWLMWPQNFGRLREILPYAVPFGVICTIGAFGPTLERGMVESLIGLEALGIYAAGVKIVALITLVTAAFQTAWAPFYLSSHKREDAPITFIWIFKIFSFGICLVALILSLLAENLIQILASNRYQGAALIVFPLAMASAIQATGWISEIGITLSKRSYLQILPYIIFLFFTMCGILIFAPIYGLLGVSLGVLIGHVAKSISSSWMAQKAYPLNWPYKEVFACFIFTLTIGLLGQWVAWETKIYLIHSTIVMCGVIALSLFAWFRMLTRLERSRICDVIIKIRVG